MSIATLDTDRETFSRHVDAPLPIKNSNRHRPLSLERLVLQTAAILLLLGLTQGGIYGTGLFFAILGMMFLGSPEMAMRAFSLGFLGLITNVAFVPKLPIWTIARFGLLALAFLRFSYELLKMRRSLFSKSYYDWLVAFILAAGVGSILGGYYVHIALFKLLSFTVGTTALFAAIYVLHLRKADLTEWFISLIAAVCVLGLLSIVLGVAYNAKNPFGNLQTTLFNGPFYHPNTAGPFCALLTLYLGCAFLLTAYQNRFVIVPLAGVLVYFLAKTQSRTGAATLVAGLLVLGALYVFQTGKRGLRIHKRWSRSGLIGIAIVGTMAIAMYDLLTGGTISQKLVSFVNKRATATEGVDIENVFASRQQLIERSFLLFKQSPLIGNGFEVDKSEAFQRNASLFSAPIEKGFLPTAVLEEVGLLGTVPFVVFAATLARAMYTTLNIPGFVMWIAFLVVNFGEVMIFSPGGHGGMGWILVGAGMLLGDQSVMTQPGRHASETDAPQ